MFEPKIFLYLPQIIGVVVITAIVLFSVNKQRSSPYTATLTLLTVWLLLQFLAQVIGNAGLSLFLIRASIATSTWMAATYYWATKCYLEIKEPRYRVWLLSIATATISLVSLSPYSIISSSADLDGIEVSEAGLMYYLQLIFIFVTFACSFIILYQNSKMLKKVQRTRNMILLLSSAQVVVLSGAGSVFLPHVAIGQALVYASAFIFCIGMFFGIFRLGLFNVHLVIARTVGYVLSLATLAAVYFSLAYLASITFFKDNVSTSLSISPANLLIALMLAFIFQPIKHFFDKATDSIFFRDRYDTDDFIARVGEILTTTIDLRSLLQRSAREIGDTLKAEQAFFYVEYGEGKHMTVGTKKHTSLPLEDIRWLKSHVSNEGVQVVDLLAADSHERILFTSHKFSALMPLTHNGITIGYLALGEQKVNGYTNRDIKVLTAISDELVIAILNALSVQEVRDINANLKQRIDAATEELRASNARLRRIDATKDEFISMASHQLRTPLTSVKGYLSMVLDGDVGKVSAAQKKLLSEAFTSSERMVHLIHDFLNVSRLQTGKFMLETGKCDIVKLVRDEVSALLRVAESRHLELTFSTKVKDCVLEIDETKIRQVVMNFVDNALYYSVEGKKVAVTLRKTTHYVEVLVADSGIGVPKAEQAQLFEKFYRASNARKHRPDGTGVGIFLAKKVVTAHGGEIIFESREGKGSTFGFRLPLAQSKSSLVK